MVAFDTARPTALEALEITGLSFFFTGKVSTKAGS